MTEPRRIAVVNDYPGFTSVLRQRATELGVTHQTLDHVTGLQSGYCSKLLAIEPIRTIGLISMGPLLQALGLRVAVEVDPESEARFAKQLSKTDSPMLAFGEHSYVKYRISRKKLGVLARKGAKKRNARLSPKKRTKLARRAAKVRWRRERQRRIELNRRRREKRSHPNVCPAANHGPDSTPAA